MTDIQINNLLVCVAEDAGEWMRGKIRPTADPLPGFTKGKDKIILYVLGEKEINTQVKDFDNTLIHQYNAKFVDFSGSPDNEIIISLTREITSIRNENLVVYIVGDALREHINTKYLAQYLNKKIGKIEYVSTMPQKYLVDHARNRKSERQKTKKGPGAVTYNGEVYGGKDALFRNGTDASMQNNDRDTDTRQNTSAGKGKAEGPPNFTKVKEAEEEIFGSTSRTITGEEKKNESEKIDSVLAVAGVIMNDINSMIKKFKDTKPPYNIYQELINMVRMTENQEELCLSWEIDQPNYPISDLDDKSYQKLKGEADAYFNWIESMI